MKRNKKTSPAGSGLSMIVIGCLGITALASAVIYFLTGYLLLLLVGIIMFAPALINLVLLIPVPVSTDAPPKTEAPREIQKQNLVKRVFCAVKKALKKCAFLFKNLFLFLKRKRTAVVATLVALILGVSNILYWSALRLPSQYTLRIYIPVILAGIFIICIILEKLCKHTNSEGVYTVILNNVLCVLRISKFIWLVAVVVTALAALGVYDLTRFAVILLSVYFVYYTVFTVLALTVRLIRQEFDTNPDLYIPMPWQRGENLGVLTYLEENTGITMRSLWSVRFIKRVIPYAVMGTALVLWLSSGFVMINSNEEGALYRLGKLSNKTLDSGIHITLPWPFDRVEIYDTGSVNQITVGYLSEDETDNLWTEAHGNNEYKLLLGGGEELVSINLRIHYRIGDLLSYLKNSSSPASLLESAAYETVTNVTIGTDLDSMLAADRAAFSESFKKQLTERIKDYNTGLEVVSVVIESIHPPVEIADIYQQIISAGIEAEKLILDAENTAGITLAAAESQYHSDVNGATANSSTAIAEAKASVAEFMASAKADSEYGDGYRYYKYLTALKNAYSGAKLIIVGSDIDTSNIYLGSLN